MTDNNSKIEMQNSLAVEQIIDIVRTKRNDIIKGLLTNSNFEPYFERTFRSSLSKVKSMFIKRELQEMLIMPVDLVHYATLINRIRNSSGSLITAKDEEHFFREIDAVLKKYCF